MKCVRVNVAEETNRKMRTYHRQALVQVNTIQIVLVNEICTWKMCFACFTGLQIRFFDNFFLSFVQLVVLLPKLFYHILVLRQVFFKLFDERNKAKSQEYNVHSIDKGVQMIYCPPQFLVMFWSLYIS